MKRVIKFLFIVSILNFIKDLILFYFTGSVSNLSFLFLIFMFILRFGTKYKKLIFFISIFFIIELSLSFLSPYKSYTERNGKWSFIAPFFKSPYAEPYKKNESKRDENLEFDFVHNFNDIGYEDEDVGNQKHFKAFILGDSFIQGIGVSNFNAIDKQLERKLNCENCVLNMGLAGSELRNHLNLLKDLNSKSFTADYIVLNVNSTDINDLMIRCNEIPELSNLGRSLFFQYIYGNSFIFRHIFHDIFKLKYNLLYEKEELILENEAQSLIVKTIDNYQKFSIKNNSEFIVVFQPMLYECRNKDYQLNKVITILNKEKPDIKHIDFLHIFEGDCENYYWPIDMHFNKKGYEKYATQLFNQLLLKYPEFQQ